MKVDTEVRFVTGVGERLSGPLAKLGIKTVSDLLFHVPRRYEDRTKLPAIRDLRPGDFVTVRGRVVDFEGRPTRRGGMVILKALISDGTGRLVLTWFNQPWVKKTLEHYEGEVIAYGQVKAGNNFLEMNTPEWETIGEDAATEKFAKVVPIYPATEGVGQKTFRKIIANALEKFGDEIEETLPRYFLRAFELPGIRQALEDLHSPATIDQTAAARKRLILEEFIGLQLAMQLRLRQIHREAGIAFPIRSLEEGSFSASNEVGSDLFAQTHQSERDREPLWDQIHRLLPFRLTGAQQRVIGEIYQDMASPHPMNRLVQGDVGSGKTAVAACAMLAAVRSGYQAVLMAPTEILAEQHFSNLSRLFEPVGIPIGLLIGKQGKRDRERNLAGVADGSLPLAVGTQALVQEGVSFQRLGLVVIDEQHRFGVLQRAALRQKGLGNPDVLVMTATPIPRTLSMTMFGDMDKSQIDELPPNRQKIVTRWFSTAQRGQVYEEVRKHLQEGAQVYVVCPMVEESEKMTAQAAEDLFYRLSKEVYPEFSVGLLHGQMKAKDKEEVMSQFRNGNLQLLVSTTVIEVGVDVPNASIMIIEDANRFGLSQLHQLRGRVGRGSKASYCILIADTKSEDSSRRMSVMVETTDGFKIAEEDLQIRGPGELIGTRQSGNLDFRHADLVRDLALLEEARKAAVRILETDPDLSRPENAGLKKLADSRTPEESLIPTS